MIEIRRSSEWRSLLLDATRRVQSKASRTAARGESTKSAGVGASGDVTLVADKLAEEEIIRALARVKDLRIVSEEAGEVGNSRSRLVAVVDPLDGSSNFERGIRFYCTSVALAEGDTMQKVDMGLVRNLVTGDVYWAEKGKGSTKNGRSVTTSGTSSLAAATLAIDLSRGSPDLTARLGPLISSVKRQVHMGANALEICLLAEGTIDGFIDLRKMMRVTDFAAASLIASEAGAVVTDLEGRPIDSRLDLKSRFSVVAASNRDLHEKILRAIAG